MNSESETHAPFYELVSDDRYHEQDEADYEYFRASAPVLIPNTTVVNATEKTMLDRKLRMTDEKQQKKNSTHWSRIVRSNTGKE